MLPMNDMYDNGGGIFDTGGNTDKNYGQHLLI